MDNNTERILSEREMREWIPGCPMQIKKIKLFKTPDSNNSFLSLFYTACGNIKIDSFTVDIELQNDRRENIGKLEGITKKFTDDSTIDTGTSTAVYAFAIITNVNYQDGAWNNEERNRGKIPTEQPIIWQTDPLYAQIKRECNGKVDAKYYPDTIEGAWRCTCGQINLEKTSACGNCKCEKKWLDIHFDKSLLEKNNREWEEKSAREVETKKKKRHFVVTDKIKAICILAAIALVVGFVFLTISYIIPSIRYISADKNFEKGEYDKAHSTFIALGEFRDSPNRAIEVQLKKAQDMTGLEDVYMATTKELPWFTISEEGSITFRKDEYKGDWTNVVIPDIIDGIIVREISGECFINCKDMTSIKISDCIEVIGEQAFLNCSLLKNVDFGKNVRVIEHRAFIGCESLEEITIPDGVTGALGNRMFNKCSSLKKVTLGSGITSIGAYAFSICPLLETITITSPIESIGESALYDCASLKEIVCKFDKSKWIEPTIGADNDIYKKINIKYQ